MGKKKSGFRVKKEAEQALRAAVAKQCHSMTKFLRNSGK